MKVFSKKAGRLLAAACATVLTVSAAAGVFVAHADEAHIHTFSDKWSSDSKNHFHASTCSHDIITDAEAHTYGGNGSCTVCGYKPSEPAHVHTYSNVWSRDELNHWHAADCGHAVARDTAAHVFIGGVCECGYQEPAVTHKHSYNSSFEHNTAYHWRAADCGHDIVRDMAKHMLVNGVCVCGYSNVSGGFTVVSGAYGEGLYAEWAAESTAGVTVSYQLKGESGWTAVDKELIRLKNGNTVRADVVGLKAGEYNLKVTSGGATATVNDITVTEYDRAGYAHFKASEGVGGYNNDGTPKKNAQIIYVTEETKNTVSVTWSNKTYTGIANILSNSSKCPDPLIVRVIGRVAAATWNSKTYSGTVTPSVIQNNTPGTDGAKLELKSYSQKELIDGGFNTLDETQYKELKGLSSTMRYDSSKNEFDSCWNNCSISGAKNVTVEGIGTDAELFQWGMTWGSCNSIEVRNLTFDDYTEDACSFEGSDNKTSADEFAHKRFWIHHNTFNEGKNYWDVCNEQDKHEGDGATDFKKLSYVTISYNHYYKNHKTGLIGGSDSQTTANVTFHHNYYDTCNSRLPLARQANMHMYNNYYFGSTGTNMSLRSNSVALIEYCYFKNANGPVTTNDTSALGVIWQCTFTGKKLSEVEKRVVVINTRDNENGVNNTDNANSFGGMNYYLNSSLFYFTTDSAIRSNKFFIETADIPERIPQLAGVHK